MRAIKDIEKLGKDLRKLDMKLTPDIIGFYGELLVWKELKSHFGWKGYKIGFGSGQSKADIILKKNERQINVEVKTSRLKDEGLGWWYGVALNIKKCKDAVHHRRSYLHPKKGKVFGDFCYFDYLIFVALGENADKPKFYIIPRSFIEKHERLLRNDHKRFSSSTHRIILSNNKMPKVSAGQKMLIHKTKKFQNRWDRIL